MDVAPEAMDIHNAEQQKNHVCDHVDVREAFADTVAWGFTPDRYNVRVNSSRSSGLDSQPVGG